MCFKVEYLINHGANLNLVASKRDLANGAKLTPRELAVAIQFEPMSVFDSEPEVEPAPEPEPACMHATEPEPEPMVTSSPAAKATPSSTQGPSPSKVPENAQAAREVEEKKIAYTKAELDAMIQKALTAKMAEFMRMNEEKNKAETPPKEENIKSREDLEVEAAMGRMRADEAKERAENKQ